MPSNQISVLQEPPASLTSSHTKVRKHSSFGWQYKHPNQQKKNHVNITAYDGDAGFIAEWPKGKLAAQGTQSASRQQLHRNNFWHGDRILLDI